MDAALVAADVARRLDLSPHPEGGWYRETHRSGKVVAWNGASRAASTSILFLLEHPGISRLHRIDAEELWYWHAGSDLLIQEIAVSGELRTHHLGPGGVFQAAIPAGSWFGAELAAPGTWALVGCAVAPGFEFSGFELAEGADLARVHPAHEALVRRLAP
jgi:predicted cupin superfamily sugar epimerase